jgi:hypothetical protein
MKSVHILQVKYLDHRQAVMVSEACYGMGVLKYKC